MAESDDAASQRVAELFRVSLHRLHIDWSCGTAFIRLQACRSLHRESYPHSLVDFDRLDLTGTLTHGTWAQARGHFADVYRGKMDDGTAVAVKVLRLPVYTPHDDKIYRTALLRFFREINLWSTLDHPNIVACLGYTLAGGNISLISPWHDKGNLIQFLRTSPNASEPDLILDVAEGTQYLHTRSKPLIHGDLKGANILVTEHGSARLADFGISRQIEDMNRNTGFTTTSGAAGTIPWMAPELERGSPLAFSCDIYSCAGVFLEICCPGKTPYHYLRQTRDIILAKDSGAPPDLAQYPEMDVKMALWKIMCACWAHDPDSRPAITSVVKSLYTLFKLTPRVSESVTLRPTLLQFSFFFYGTLMHPSILRRVLRHHGTQLEAAPALLDSYVRVQVASAEYPALVSFETARAIGLAKLPRYVEGLVVQGFTAADVVKLHKFDGANYGREVVEVYRLASFAPLSSFTGKRRIKDWKVPRRLPPTMVTTGNIWSGDLGALTPKVWSYETFEEQSAALWYGPNNGHDRDESDRPGNSG